MRLNKAGSAALGVGDGIVSIDGREVAKGGSPCWWTEKAIVYQRKPPAAGGRYVLEAYHIDSGQKIVVDETGANEVYGGDGLWAAWTMTKVPNAPQNGVRTSAGGHWPSAGLLDVSREGVLAICPDRQVGKGAELHYPDGRVIKVPDCVSNGVRLVGSVLVWVQGGRVHAYGAPDPVTIAPPLFTPVPIVTPAGFWLLYQDGNRLLLQPWNEPIGYVVHAEPTTFNPDAVCLSDGRIRVAWSHTQGEGPAALRTATIDLSSRRVSLLRPTAPIDPSVPPSPVRADTLQADPRKLWIGPIFSFGRYGDTSPEQFGRYGNVAVLVGDERDPSVLQAEVARVAPLGLPLIVAGRVDKQYLNTVIAYWVSGADLAALGTRVREALTWPEKPVIAYLDRGAADAWPSARPTWCTARVWPGVQAYRQAGETIEAMSRRVDGMLTTIEAWGVYAVLTPRFDDVNGTQPVSFTLAAMPVYDAMIKRFKVIGVMPFADRRGYGISADADLMAWATAFLRANPARPNRYDGWTPDKGGYEASIRNKLGQSVELLMLSTAERAYILDALPREPGGQS